MRFRFSPRKWERMIFMGTLLPEEKKVRYLIEEVDNFEEQYADTQDDGGIRKTIRSSYFESVQKPSDVGIPPNQNL